MAIYDKVGGEITVNTTYARSQAQAEVAQLADGRFIVTWLDADFSTTAGRYVRAQIYEADGTASGGELTLAGPLNGAVQPTVTGLEGGGFVVGWLGFGSIAVRVFDSSGAQTGSAITVTTGSSTGHPDIAALADGGFAISWHDTRSTGDDVSGAGVHMRTYDAGGAATSGDILVNTATAGNQAFVSIAALAGGGHVVTWTDSVGSGSADDRIMAQVFDASGVAVGGALVLALTPVISDDAAVTALANGNFAVAWNESDIDLGPAHRIQVFTPAGVSVGAEIVLAANHYGTQVGPVLTALADGGLAIAWTANYTPTSDGSAQGVFVQVYDASGEACGGPIQVNSQANGDQFDPSIVALDNGGFVVTWTDTNGAGADDDQVMAQVFGPAGSSAPVTIASNGGGETAAVTAAENGLTAAQIVATGGAGTLVYSIAGGADAASFVVDTDSGALAFLTAPDFEAPADADGDNVYDVIVSVSDGTSTDSQTLSVTVTNVNEAPLIVSDGGGTSAVREVAEGATAVTTVAAQDPDGATALTYAIAGGADAALFAIDPETGALSFVTAPDYEAPADDGADNVYDVIVSASDGEHSSLQAISILVGDVQETSLSFEQTSFAEWENGSEGVALGVVGGNSAEPVYYTITGGADAALFELFELFEQEGLLLLAPQDYEAPADADGDNVYEVEVTAQQGTQLVTTTLSFTLNDINEQPWFVSDQLWLMDEGQDFVGTLEALDPEDAGLMFFVAGGADGDLFQISPETGEFGFFALPDFELPADADGDNIYEVEFGVHDGEHVVITTMFVKVQDVAETLTFAETAFFGWENDLVAATVALTAYSATASYTISGGADAALFTLDSSSGVLSFLSPPDFEAPADADGDHVYEVEVTAIDGSSSGTETIFVSVSDVNEGPSIATTAMSAPENSTFVGTVAASDPEYDLLSYNLVGGADRAHFVIDAYTGELRFRTPPDFETPGDANGDNVYDLVIRVSDGVLAAQQTISVTVHNVAEAPVIVSGGGGATASYALNENVGFVGTIAASAPEGAVTFALTGGADAARFTINGMTGALSFVIAPDYDAPTDADGDSVYEVIVSASDGSLSDSQALSVAVGNLVDGQIINGTSKGNVLTGSYEEDTIRGLGGNDTLYGMGGDDTLEGGDGHDDLVGGAGADRLTGGAGRDSFVFTALGDSTVDSCDRILDFSRAQGDKIDLSDLDANALAAGNQAFSFIGAAEFSSAAGQLRYFQQGGDTFVVGDVDGDGIADFQIVIDPQLNLIASDFVL